MLRIACCDVGSLLLLASCCVFRVLRFACLSSWVVCNGSSGLVSGCVFGMWCVLFVAGCWLLGVGCYVSQLLLLFIGDVADVGCSSLC